MGRYSSSDSEDDHRRSKKKKKRKSRSRSASSVESYSSSKRNSKKAKKSKKKHRKRSRSRSRSSDYRKRRSRSRSRGRRSRSRGRRSRSRGRRSRSRSSSFSRSYRSRRSRSGSRSRKSSRSRRKSRSRSWSKRNSRSRSRSRVKRRSRSRSRSKNVTSRSSSVSRDSKPSTIKEEKVDPCANIPGFQEMSLVEQNQVRMKMALKAAAETDARLREQGVLLPNKKEGIETLYGDDSKRQRAIADIEGDSFTQQSFLSNRGQGRVKEESADDIHEAAMFGDAPTLPTITSRKGIVYSNTDSLLAPVFYEDPAEKWERWAQYVRDYRRTKLEGEAMS